MLSRVANSIYWMSRYVERAENVARFVDVNLHFELDCPTGVLAQWEPLVTTTGDRDLFLARYDGFSRENVINFLTFDLENPNSILSCLWMARENARSIREMLSTEIWEQINSFYLQVRRASRSSGRLDSPYAFFKSIKTQSHLYIGLTVTTLLHDEGWHFCRLGRLLERADKTTRILDMKYFYLLPSVEEVGSPVDTVHWGALLQSASAFEAYRRRHGTINPGHIIDFLLLDRTFPRAVVYCLIRAEDSLHTITGSPANTFCNRAERLAGQVRSELAFLRVQEVFNQGLHEFLDQLESRMNEIGEAIYETYFEVRQHAGAVAAPVLRQEESQ